MKEKELIQQLLHALMTLTDPESGEFYEEYKAYLHANDRRIIKRAIEAGKKYQTQNS